MKRILKTAIFTMFFILTISIISKVNAAEGSFSVSPTSKSLEKGKSVKVTITAKDCGGKFAIASSDTNIATVSESSVWIESESKTITVKAVGEGTATISVTAESVATSGETPEDVTGTKNVTIKVNDPSNDVNDDEKEDNTDKKEDEEQKEDNKTTETKLSSDATLSTLGVTPKEYDFTGFKKTKTEYSVTIPNEVDSLKVAYKTSDSKAKVKITGNTNLEVGTSTIKVVVTAEDGKTTKTYKIKVTKLAAEEEKPGNIIDEEEETDLDLALKSLEIKGIELSPEFSSDVYSYEATIDMDNNDIKKVEITAETNQYGAEIETTGNTNLVEGENLINIIVKSGFSDEQVVYQITLNKVSKTSEVVSNSENNGIKKEHLIIGGFIFIVVLILTIIIINTIRNRSYYEDEEDEGEENEDTEEFNNFSKTSLNNKDNFIEELYNKKKSGNNLNSFEKETLEDIQKENDRIFNKQEETIENKTNEEDPFLRELREKRKKGKH